MVTSIGVIVDGLVHLFLGRADAIGCAKVQPGQRGAGGLTAQVQPGGGTHRTVRGRTIGVCDDEIAKVDQRTRSQLVDEIGHSLNGFDDLKENLDRFHTGTKEPDRIQHCQRPLTEQFGQLREYRHFKVQEIKERVQRRSKVVDEIQQRFQRVLRPFAHVQAQIVELDAGHLQFAVARAPHPVDVQFGLDVRQIFNAKTAADVGTAHQQQVDVDGDGEIHVQRVIVQIRDTDLVVSRPGFVARQIGNRDRNTATIQQAQRQIGRKADTFAQAHRCLWRVRLGHVVVPWGCVHPQEEQPQVQFAIRGQPRAEFTRQDGIKGQFIVIDVRQHKKRTAIRT